MKTEACAKEPTEFHSEIDIKVNDFLLTPLACATLINEIFKNLLYQKAQIPYTYSWLKTIVDKKRQRTEPPEEAKKPNNFKILNHFRTVSSTYDAINTVTTSIKNELKSSSSNQLKEVVFLFGITPFCPKEVFTIRFSSLAFGHSESHHEAETSRKQHKVLRDIFLSETWMSNSIDNSLPCTNVYVFLKYNGNFETLSRNDEVFTPSKPLFLPSKVKHTLINLNLDDTQRHMCCGNFQVFKDMNTPVKTFPKPLNIDDVDHDENNDICEEFWTQSKFLIQGFKDCFINKVPVCELW